MERQMRQKDSLIQPRTLCVFWNGLRVSERFHERNDHGNVQQNDFMNVSENDQQNDFMNVSENDQQNDFMNVRENDQQNVLQNDHGNVQLNVLQNDVYSRNVTWAEANGPLGVV